MNTKVPRMPWRETTEELLAQLQSPNGSISRAAASKLAHDGERRAVEPLLAILTDCARGPHGESRLDQRCLGAIEALGRLTDPCAVEPLIQLLRQLYADYNQFYLGDAEFEQDTASPEFWSKEAFDRGLALSPTSFIGVGTARYDFVPVVLEHRLGHPERSEGSHGLTRDPSARRLASG